MMVDYLFESLKSEILIIGIQPKTLMFGENVSKEVMGSVKDIKFDSKILQKNRNKDTARFANKFLCESGYKNS